MIERKPTKERALVRGHYSGIVDHVLLEDVVVQAGVGSIASRQREFLISTDLGIHVTRKILLGQLERFEGGELIDGSMPAVNRDVTAQRALIPSDSDWALSR